MFNWDEFRNEKVAVWCDTEEEAREFIKECYKRGLKWRDFTESKTMFNWCKEDTCYNFKINEDRNALTFSNKSYYERNNYKIIKWESEKMNFKVGDRIEVTNNRCNEPYFNVGDIGTIVAIYGANADVKFDNPKRGDVIWTVAASYMKKIKTEFTFQEVIARIKKGDVYVSTKSLEFEAKIDLVNEGLRIRYFKDGSCISRMNAGFVITHQNRFKLQEPKKKVQIIKVEHGKDRKQYEFVSINETDYCSMINEGDFVECDTKQGNSYGRCVGRIVKELTEKEIKEYRECWRA